MKKIGDLNFGFSDAINYKTREEKERFNQIFIRNSSLSQIYNPKSYFIIGEKGTGKTAYAVYAANNNMQNTFADIKYVKETDYVEFVALKEKHHLSLSNYTVIWKVILFMLLSDNILKTEKGFVSTIFKKFNALQQATEDYYHQAFSPEVESAFEFITDSKVAAELIHKNLQLKMGVEDSIKVNHTKFQTNLLYIKKSFEEAFSQLKLKKNHIIFIDGIDFRPGGMSHDSYLECIKGLANAIWDLNTDFFPNIKDSVGRCKVMLLTRPDIFDSLSLQNTNAKLKDNSVILNWTTDYKSHRNSEIFEVTEKLLSSQHENTSNAEKLWDKYFPWNAPNAQYLESNNNNNNNNEEEDNNEYTSFVAFLRWSYHKPRDILTMLSILQNYTDPKDKKSFSLEDFKNHSFIRAYSNYLLGEVKDQLSFYYESKDYESFLKFFEFLNGKNKFTYSEYLSAFNETQEYLESRDSKTPNFMSTANDFLQFLYGLNIICYMETPLKNHANVKVVPHWSFRERNSANISPSVKINAEKYEVFYGLRKALNVEIQTK
ncbi:funZ protein [Wohlfahrtiimonas chitiniclastica]|nr:funZ protein [Wohlfahrtiimonas chitiniclastica]